jgi:hypothetical protein
LCDIHYNTTYKNLGEYKKAIENNPTPQRKTRVGLESKQLVSLLKGQQDQ